MAHHELKVQPPYFDALLSGEKTFEVRRNDRGFQKGDALTLTPVNENGFPRRDQALNAEITFVYTGDPRFHGHGGMRPGWVVLALAVQR